jgi:hypothetical protein
LLRDSGLTHLAAAAVSCQIVEVKEYKDEKYDEKY